MDQDNDIVIQVVHYNKDPLRLHGVPFRFVVKKVKELVTGASSEEN